MGIECYRRIECYRSIGCRREMIIWESSARRVSSSLSSFSPIFLYLSVDLAITGGSSQGTASAVSSSFSK